MKKDVEEAARIEREKILKELKDGFGKHKDISLYNAFATTIEKYAVPLFKAGAEWQEKQSPWISVEERLPDLLQRVIIRVDYYGDDDFYVAKYFGNGIWETPAITITGSSIGIKVTHYMPIPTFDQILEANKDVLQRLKDK